MEQQNEEKAVEQLAEAMATEVEKKAEEVKPEPTTEEKIQAILTKRKTAPLSLKDSTELRILKKQLRAVQVQRGYFQKVIGQWRKNDEKARNRLVRQIRAASKTLGKQNFAMLKDLYTQTTPEQKNEAGEITQAASSNVNYQGLLAEAKHAIVLERESRIKSGKRKKTTGRSSKRRNHKDTFNFLTKRNAEESIKQVQQAKE